MEGGDVFAQKQAHALIGIGPESMDLSSGLKEQAHRKHTCR